MQRPLSRCVALCVVCIVRLDLCSGWTVPLAAHAPSPTKRYSASVCLDSGAEDNASSLDMQLLLRRIKDLKETEAEGMQQQLQETVGHVDLIVMYSPLLPGQRGSMRVDARLACELVATEGSLAVIGSSCISEGDQRERPRHKLLTHGVEAIVAEAPRLRPDGAFDVELLGGRRFELLSLPKREGGADDQPLLSDATVRWCDEDARAAAGAAADGNGCADERRQGVEEGFELERLLLRWIGLVRALRLEREPGLIDRTMQDLRRVAGRPDPSRPGQLALWVASLISSPPLLHVLSEDVRPDAIAARSTAARVGAVKRVLEDSIAMLRRYSAKRLLC